MEGMIRVGKGEKGGHLATRSPFLEGEKLRQNGPRTKSSHEDLPKVNSLLFSLSLRNRWAAADVESLDSQRWLFVETNFDHWKPDGDQRRWITDGSDPSHSLSFQNHS